MTLRARWWGLVSPQKQEHNTEHERRRRKHVEAEPGRNIAPHTKCPSLAAFAPHAPAPAAMNVIKLQKCAPPRSTPLRASPRC